MTWAPKEVTGREPARRGRILLRVTPELHEILAEAAEREGISLNAFLAEILARHVGLLEARSEVEQLLAKTFCQPYLWRPEANDRLIRLMNLRLAGALRLDRRSSPDSPTETSRSAISARGLVEWCHDG